jgi:hypothetical protein
VSATTPPALLSRTCTGRSSAASPLTR